MLSKIVWAVVLSSIWSSVVGEKPQFEPRNRPYQRGIIGQRVELPCMVHNIDGEYMKFSWWRRRTGLPGFDMDTLISRGSVEMLTGHQDRVSIREDKRSSTYMLTIDPVRDYDTGEFVCMVEMGRGQGKHNVSKIFKLEAVENFRNSVKWRADSKCGRSASLPFSDEPAECDAQGAYPCCSDYGWCGFSDAHCDCPSCVDYSA